MLGDNNYGDGSPESYQSAIRGAVQAAARRRRQVLRGARQPRCRPAMGISALQHGRTAVLHVSSAKPACCRRSSAIACSSSRSTPSISMTSSSAGSIEQLSESKAEWKIVFFHHPIYSSGRYALSSAARRATLEHVLDRAPGRRRVCGSRASVRADGAAERRRCISSSGRPARSASATCGRLPTRRGLRPRSQLHARRDPGRHAVFSGGEPGGRDDRSRENRQDEVFVVAGHAGRSTICRTRSWNTAVHAGTSSRPAAVKSVSICLRDSCRRRLGEQAPAFLGNRDILERAAVVRHRFHRHEALGTRRARQASIASCRGRLSSDRTRSRHPESSRADARSLPSSHPRTSAADSRICCPNGEGRPP